MSSNEIRMLEYKGNGSGYLVVIYAKKKSDIENKLILDTSTPIQSFLVRKNEPIAVTEATYYMLNEQGHIGKQKLEPVST